MFNYIIYKNKTHKINTLGEKDATNENWIITAKAEKRVDVL